MLALMISLLCLCACGNARKLEGSFDEWREDFLSSPERAITAKITSSIGDVHGEYKISYYKSDTEESVTIIEPESLSNIKAHMAEDGTKLSFDGVILETGGGISNKLSPLTALPYFMDYLESGFIKGVWTEKDGEFSLLVAELELSDASRMTLWLDNSSMAPLYAAIRQDSSIEIEIKLLEVS